MADAAKVALERFESEGAGPDGKVFRPVNSLAKACLQGKEIEPSIAVDLGPTRKHDLWDAIVVLSDGSYNGGKGRNPEKKSAVATIGTIAAAVLIEKEQLKLRGENGEDSPPFGAAGHKDYVNSDRIEELRSLRSENFDLTRLIRLCEELNVVSRAECHMAKAMLIRALIDHVPPIFGATAFSQLSSYSGGGKSFKEAIQRSGVLRAIADGHLHLQIRSREVLPTANQVNFQNEIDAILGEVVRILK